MTRTLCNKKTLLVGPDGWVGVVVVLVVEGIKLAYAVFENLLVNLYNIMNK